MHRETRPYASAPTRKVFYVNKRNLMSMKFATVETKNVDMHKRRATYLHNLDKFGPRLLKRRV